MHSKDFFINDCRDRQAIETIRKCFPELNVITPLTFVVKSVNAVDGGAFVVAAKDEEVFWILDLVRQQEADCLKRLLSSIYIVAQEQVISFWRKATVLEEA